MPQIALDRMAVDDVATTPERIVAEIHRQLGDIPPPIPVYEIARELDIADIEEKPLSSFEGILITDKDRDLGVIGVNRRSSIERRRYSVGHELGHFLCQWHVQTQGSMFECTTQDMASPKGDPTHVLQENEANRFAIDLLAPERFLAPYRKRHPELEHVLALHSSLRISKIAAARRYVSLSSHCLAAIFAKDGQYLYSERAADFPYLRFHKGHLLPTLPRAGPDTTTSEMVDADARDWPGLERSKGLSVQCLEQADGYTIILLHLEPDTAADD